MNLSASAVTSGASTGSTASTATSANCYADASNVRIAATTTLTRRDRYRARFDCLSRDDARLTTSAKASVTPAIIVYGSKLRVGYMIHRAANTRVANKLHISITRISIGLKKQDQRRRRRGVSMQFPSTGMIGWGGGGRCSGYLFWRNGFTQQDADDMCAFVRRYQEGYPTAPKVQEVHQAPMIVRLYEPLGVNVSTSVFTRCIRILDAQNDLAHLDKLRPRTARLRRLLEKADDGETALGSDVMSAALEGYALLKVSGKGAVPGHAQAGHVRALHPQGQEQGPARRLASNPSRRGRTCRDRSERIYGVHPVCKGGNDDGL